MKTLIETITDTGERAEWTIELELPIIPRKYDLIDVPDFISDEQADWLEANSDDPYTSYIITSVTLKMRKGIMYYQVFADGRESAWPDAKN